MRRLYALLLLFAGAYASAQTAGEPAALAPTLALPQVILLPLRPLEIDSARVAQARPYLNASTSNWQNAFVNGGARLNDYLTTGNMPITRNLARRLAPVAAGASNALRPSAPVMIEPTWCAVMDQYVLFMQAADAKSHRLLDSQHTVISRAEWERRVQNRSLEGYLSQSLAALTRSLQLNAAQPASSMHVEFKLHHNVSRFDEGSSHCLKALEEEEFAKRFVVIKSLGASLAASIRRALAMPAALRRPTRLISLAWTHPQVVATTRTLPATWQLHTTYAESVFGKPFNENKITTYTLSTAQNKLRAQKADNLSQNFLANEDASLKHADLPSVAKVYGAWVYLDRGRAWGLQMRDRLVAKNGEIKGHVVRYFGPEEGLSSPRGFPIKEGAIVFIRKGQGQTRLGDEFTYDETTYPTDIPN